MACDNMVFFGKAASCQSPYCTRKSPTSASTASLSLNRRSWHYSVQEVLKTDCQFVNHLPEVYTKYNIMAEMESDIASFLQATHMVALEFDNDFRIKKLKRSHVYEDYVPNGILVYGPLQQITHRRPSYWSNYKSAPRQKLAYHATALSKV